MKEIVDIELQLDTMTLGDLDAETLRTLKEKGYFDRWLGYLLETTEHCQRTRYFRDHRGRPAYSLLSMFKAVLLGQWIHEPGLLGLDLEEFGVKTLDCSRCAATALARRCQAAGVAEELSIAGIPIILKEKIFIEFR